MSILLRLSCEKEVPFLCRERLEKCGLQYQKLVAYSFLVLALVSV